jgi:predicted ATPase
MEPGGALWMVGGGGVGNSILAAACVTANFPAAQGAARQAVAFDIALTGGEQPFIKTQHVPSHTLDLPCGQGMSPC